MYFHNTGCFCVPSSKREKEKEGGKEMKVKAAFFVFSTLIVFDLYHSKRIV